MNVLFEKANELCIKNPEFQSSLVVLVPKAAVVKATSAKGGNAKTDVRILNFIRLIGTYDKRAAQVVSANLGCPGNRWVRKVNARKREDCMIASGNNGEHITERMTQTIERRKKDGLPPAFSLAIDATKNTKVLEVSHAHGKSLEARIHIIWWTLKGAPKGMCRIFWMANRRHMAKLLWRVK